MKVRYALLAAVAMLTPAFAGATDPAVDTAATESHKRLSGSLTVGYDTNYTGRGYVVSHSVAQGDSVEYLAAKLSYDIGKKGLWTLGSTIAYTIPSSGHVLYGNPPFSQQGAYAAIAHKTGLPFVPTAPGQTAAVLGAAGVPGAAAIGAQVDATAAAMTGQKIKEANIENQFSVITEAKYTSPTEQWNIAFGHHFSHGGLLGVMAKHYRDQGASVVNEVFVAPEWTPYKWLSLGCKTSYSFQGIQGWWFEPYVTVKAPIIGTPDDIKLLGVATIGMSATYGYFDEAYSACSNGTQAVWIKLSTPWFVTDNFIVTPSISFNWLGNGGMKANKVSEFKQYTGNPNNFPFRNFGVVAGISATYRF